MTRHSTALGAPAPALDDLTSGASQPLTRRELRERERRVQESAAAWTVTETAALPQVALIEAETGAAPADTPAAAPDAEAPALVTPALVVSALVAAAQNGPVFLPPVVDAPQELSIATTVSPTTSSIPVAPVPVGATVAPVLDIPSRRSQRTVQRPSSGAPRVDLTRPPAPAWTPSRVLAASAPRRNGRVGILAAKGASVVAMAFVALMAVSTSLPAEALLSSADVRAAVVAPGAPAKQDAQKLNVASGIDTLSVERDGFDSKSVAEVAVASGIRLENSFVNNPNGTIQWPFAVGVHVGDEFGHRDCAGCSANHGGQDFNPGLGAPIQAIADGVVSLAEDGEGSLGVHMMIDHVIDGKTVTSVYAHMVHGSMLFNQGDVVKVGDIIGKTGTTGMSTGPHLHFEIRLGGIDGTKVDPLVWLRENTN
ncbi:M23 family metallopeptidase [Glaciibacter psychrotolerans]|uniref:Murein DD-endopeptidase MepM/ murein hydrolase activator NlpD n=1 Tax=Glaciibacter psychrotolerans TaxID=670054 RepID=A0A7Z0J799_9MICO|nr:M23 family metallopeptidase [Leifsonia psychrotolerans]NYJ20708.1 murein DD-endopeptidase MepM/ murein hydrolase activator NlpD [Leifsonia psychrotolerans]